MTQQEFIEAYREARLRFERFMHPNRPSPEHEASADRARNAAERWFMGDRSALSTLSPVARNAWSIAGGTGHPTIAKLKALPPV